MIRPYIEYMKKSFQNTVVYRINTLFNVLNSVISVFVFIAIWKAVYNYYSSNINGISFKMTATYFIFSIGLSAIFMQTDHNSIVDKIRKGNIILDFLKPVSFYWFNYSKDFGIVIFKLLSQFIPTIIVAAFFVGIEKPYSMISFIIFLLSIILGFFIVYNLNFIVSVSAFFIQKIFALRQLKDALIVIFSGVFFPVWFMPEILKKMLIFLPFESIYYVPINIYLGKIAVDSFYLVIIKQFLWGIALFLINQLLIKIALKKIVVQGG